MRKIITAALLTLASCTPSRHFETIGCLNADHSNVVLISRTTNNSALDGYDYKICTTGHGMSCGSYDTVTALRPVSIYVYVLADAVRVKQVGGSVGNYVTDPAGMQNPAFKTSTPIELSYQRSGNQSAGDVKYFIGSNQTPLLKCH